MTKSPIEYSAEERAEAYHKGMHKDPKQSSYNEDENMRDSRLEDPIAHMKMNRELHGEEAARKRASEVMKEHQMPYWKEK